MLADSTFKIQKNSSEIGPFLNDVIKVAFSKTNFYQLNFTDDKYN